MTEKQNVYYKILSFEKKTRVNGDMLRWHPQVAYYIQN